MATEEACCIEDCAKDQLRFDIRKLSERVGE